MLLCYALFILKIIENLSVFFQPPPSCPYPKQVHTVRPSPCHSVKTQFTVDNTINVFLLPAFPYFQKSPHQNPLCISLSTVRATCLAHPTHLGSITQRYSVRSINYGGSHYVIFSLPLSSSYFLSLS